MATEDPNFMTAAAALRHAQIPITRLHKLVALGLVKTRANPGESVRYSGADLDRWLSEQQATVSSNSEQGVS